MESDRNYPGKWKVHISRACKTLRSEASEHVQVAVCEYVCLTGGTQWELWFVMVIHTAGSQSCLYI